MSQSTDRGVILYLTGDGSGSYVDLDGDTQAADTLSTTYVASEAIEIGHTQDLSITVAGSLSVSTASVVVFLERQRTDDDTNNPGLFRWAQFRLPRGDSGASDSEHTILRAELLDWSDNRCDVMLGGTGHRHAGKIRVSVKATNAPSPTDWIAIGVNAL